MKVLHVTPSFYPALTYGGPTLSVYQLCLGLARNGCDVQVLTTDANGPDAVLDVDRNHDVQMANGLWVRYCHRIMDVSISPTLLRLVASRIRWADVVHLMAVYSFPTIPTLLACKLMGKPVVWSPRGMLQRWEGTSRVKSKAVWEMVCRFSSPRHLVLHVTSEEEAKESAARLPGVRLAVIPNGVEIPEVVGANNGHSGLHLVYLGRLDPKKGLENLLAAFKSLNGNLGGSSTLTIAGAGEAQYTESLRNQINSFQLSNRVKMAGALTGTAKRNLFETADLVVIPSHTENFGMVVAEALAHGVPVIASKGTPWKRVEEIGCGLWVDNSPASLASAINQISQMPLREMGQRGREWMQREFSWDLVAKQMVDLYQSTLRPNGN